jgi:hypothetical protein
MTINTRTISHTFHLSFAAHYDSAGCEPDLTPALSTEEIQSDLRDIIGHIDTVNVVPVSPLSPGSYAALARHCRKLFSPPCKSIARNKHYNRVYVLQQPKPEAFRLLQTIYGERCRVTQLHVACEYIMANGSAVWELQKYLNAHYTQRKAPTDSAGVCFQTHYTRRNSRAACRYVTYPGRGGYSKLTGELHCLRAEWRVVGSAAIARRGITTLADVASLDLRAFVQQHLDLRCVDPAALAKLHRRHVQSLKRLRSSRSRRQRLRGAKASPQLTAAVLLRRACKLRPLGSVAELKASLPYPIGTALQPLDNEWLLPAGEPSKYNLCTNQAQTRTKPGNSVNSNSTPRAHWAVQANAAYSVVTYEQLEQVLIKLARTPELNLIERISSACLQKAQNRSPP